MPTRWLSIRKRNPLLNDPDSQPTATPQEFDFAFGEQQSVVHAAPPIVGPRLVQLRPTTAGAATGKRKPRVDVPSNRPKTSENHRPSPLENIAAVSKSQDVAIGLAFGSPSHPPAHFAAHLDDDSPLDQDSSTRQFGGRHYRTGSMQSKRWRKLGTLFNKSRQALRRDDVPSGPTIGLPMGFVVLDKDPTTQWDKIAQDKMQAGQPERPRREALSPQTAMDDQSTLVASPPTLSPPSQTMDIGAASRPSSAGATDNSSVDEPHSRPPIPKLELAIPRKLEAAKRSSSLLQRRSKTLDSLKSFEDSRPTTKGTISVNNDDSSKPGSEPLTPLAPPRRLTTPTMGRSPAASKYSLFPTTCPAPVKIVGKVSNSEQSHHLTTRLTRSATSPARLSPMQDSFSLIPRPMQTTQVVHQRKDSNEQMNSSPEDNTASTDREAPWSSVHSFQSSVSSATTVDEIFFDIKSFRDSKGVEDGQFVMTRPDSVQVELARTRSKRTTPASRLRQVEALTADDGTQGTPTLPQGTPTIPPDPPSKPSSGAPSAYTTKHTSVNTAYFEEAIAAVERLTTPTGFLPTDRMPSIPTVTIGNHDERNQQPFVLPKIQTSKTPDHHLRLMSRSHDEVSRLIPSPVTEVKEDESPRPDAPSARDLTPQDQQIIAVAKAISPRFAAVKFIDRPIGDSPTLPQGPPCVPKKKAPKAPPKEASAVEDTPPPVPKKDAKFIPMSKYAAKGTVAAIEQRAGVTPRRPVRANTEDIPPRASPVRVTKDRSATLPSSLQPQPQHQASQNSLRGMEKVVPPPRPNPFSMNPVGNAEVAIARTVSLARKQSNRVHVPGPKLAARRAEAAAQTAAIHQRKPSTAATSQPRLKSPTSRSSGTGTSEPPLP